jgi:hypothetical protein
VNERELDKVLMQGRKEAGDFFSGFKPAPKELAAGAVGRSRRAWRPRAARRVAAAAVCVAAAIACALLLLSPPETRALHSAAAQSDNTPAPYELYTDGCAGRRGPRHHDGALGAFG